MYVCIYIYIYIYIYVLYIYIYISYMHRDIYIHIRAPSNRPLRSTLGAAVATAQSRCGRGWAALVAGPRARSA